MEAYMKRIIVISVLLSALFSFSAAQNADKISVQAGLFPVFTANNLNNEPVTVPEKVSPGVEVAILTFARQDLAQTDSWINTFTSLYRGNTDPSYCEVAVTGDIPIIGGIILNGIKSSLPKNKWASFLIYTGDKEKLAKTFGVDDTSLFYVYVIGKDGSIKWSAKSASATDLLVKEMLNAVKNELSR